MTLLDANLEAIMQHELVEKSIEEVCSSVDIYGYNYMEPRYEIDGEKYPSRIILGTETNPDKIAHNWDLVKKLPYLIGDYVWTGWDYLGESGVGRNDYINPEMRGIFGQYPWYMAYCGDIDICGNRRPQSYYREIVWGLRKNPYIAVERPQYYGKIAAKTNWSWTDTIESWTWYGYERKPIKVEVYSDAQEVELLVNDQIIERKIVGEEFMYKAIFDLVYTPGKITAISYNNGVETGRMDILTADEEVYLNIEVETKEVLANGMDLAFVNISLVDKNGNLNTSMDRKVKISIEGKGLLQGYGSADPTSCENFYDTERTTFDGKALAVIRTTKEKGEIIITAESDGLEPKRLIIKSV